MKSIPVWVECNKRFCFGSANTQSRMSNFSLAWKKIKSGSQKKEYHFFFKQFFDFTWMRQTCSLILFSPCGLAFVNFNPNSLILIVVSDSFSWRKGDYMNQSLWCHFIFSKSVTHTKASLIFFLFSLCFNFKYHIISLSVLRFCVAQFYLSCSSMSEGTALDAGDNSGWAGEQFLSLCGFL